MCLKAQNQSISSCPGLPAKPWVGCMAFALEIVGKPPKRTAPVSSRIKGITVAGGKATLALLPPNSLPVLQIQYKTRACANAILQHPRPLTGIGNPCYKGFFAAAEAYIFKTEGLGVGCWSTNVNEEGLIGSGRSSTDKVWTRVLERENNELCTANEILKKVSAYFIQAEFDRPFGK